MKRAWSFRRWAWSQTEHVPPFPVANYSTLLRPGSGPWLSPNNANKRTTGQPTGLGPALVVTSSVWLLPPRRLKPVPAVLWDALVHYLGPVEEPGGNTGHGRTEAMLCSGPTNGGEETDVFGAGGRFTSLKKEVQRHLAQGFVGS